MDVNVNNYDLYRANLVYFSDEDEESNVEEFEFELRRNQHDDPLTYNQIYGNSRNQRAQRMRNGIIPITSTGNIPNDNGWNMYVNRNDLNQALANRGGIVRVRTQKYNARRRNQPDELFRGYTTNDIIAGVPEGLKDYYIRVQDRRVTACTCPDVMLRELGPVGCKHQRLIRMLLPRRRRDRQQRAIRRLEIDRGSGVSSGNRRSSRLRRLRRRR
jgi:hypothetical protein